MVGVSSIEAKEGIGRALLAGDEHLQLLDCPADTLRAQIRPEHWVADGADIIYQDKACQKSANVSEAIFELRRFFGWIIPLLC